MSITKRDGLLIETGKNHLAVVARIDENGEMDPEVKDLILDLMGSIGWESVDETASRKQGKVMVFNGGMFMFPDDPAGLRKALKTAKLKSSDEVVAQVIGEWAAKLARKRGSKKK